MTSVPDLAGLMCAAAFALAALLITLSLKPAGTVDGVLFAAAILAGGVLAGGYLLSVLNALHRIEGWLLFSVALLTAACFMFWRSGRGTDGLAAVRRLPERAGATARRLAQGYGRLSTFEKRMLMPCLVTAAILAAVTLDLALHTAPHNWDSMTYHLARMAYYLQYGNLASFDANYWAQVTHPKNATILILFTYLASGQNENLTQLVQFISYGVATLAVYGISRRIGNDRFPSLFAAAVFALLTECLMQALTTQNDMLVTALIGCAVYGLFAFRQRRRLVYLALTAMTTAMALGVKSSALLVLPSLAIVALYTLNLVGDARRAARDIVVLGTLSVVFAGVFMLPAGYAENWLMYGHPIGPEYVRKLHSFEGQPPGYVLDNGTKNALRFGFEFLSLDGLPGFGDIAGFQSLLRQPPADLARLLGLNLETAEATRALFYYDEVPWAHEDMSYWGIFGFGLILPLLFAMLAGWIRSAPGRVLAWACVAFWLAQAYSGPYDPWRGRYFIIMAVFAAPALGCWVRRPHAWPVRAYLTAVVLLGCFSAFSAVVGRLNSAPEEVYRLDRVGQITRNRTNYTEAIRRYEQLVPPGATVAVWLGEDAFEYPLFGQKLTRTLIPVNSFFSGPQPIPAEADYLLYTNTTYTDQQPSDIHLGEDWYLRVLRKENNRS